MCFFNISLSPVKFSNKLLVAIIHIFYGFPCSELILKVNHTQESVNDNMEGAARRCKLWDGSEIEYSNTDEFVSELLRVGLIKKIEIS